MRLLLGDPASSFARAADPAYGWRRWDSQHRTSWLLAAAVVLPLLVPPSAVAWDLLPLEDRLALESTEISSAKVCGAGECREVSDPEAATALAVGPTPRGTDAPVRGLPWYKSTLTIPAEGGGEVDRVSVSVTVVPSAGLMRVEDGVLGDPAQREQRGLREAHSRAYAPPGEDASERGRGRAAGPPASTRSSTPSAATPAPASDGSNVWIVALGGGLLAALMAGLLLTIRHRRASTPPAAPEAPG